MGIDERIKPLRQKIEKIDDEIVLLLNERARVALEVGKIKSEGRMPVYDPRREEEVLRRLETRNEGPFPAPAVAPVFREIISACRSLEAEMTVVYLGPPATYAHLATIERFGSSIRALPKESIQDVFEAVEREKASFGVVPIENSTEGVVNRTLDMFIDADVQISGEVLLRISHDLLSQRGQPGEVERIYSHPQALAQCRQWLRKNFPSIPLVETVSTAKAAQTAAEDPKAAAIASSFAARLYGLQVIESQIEDYLHNYTRFLILSPQTGIRTGKDKTSLLFSLADSPGSLYGSLRPFAEKGINLTKVESRPIKDKPWNYVFFVDFEGHVSDPQVSGAIEELKKNVLFLKILGSYPRY